MKKNISIEVLRIFASFYVVCIHTYMNYRLTDGVYSRRILFIEAFTRCAVPVFLMITGFVMFPIRKKVVAVWKNFFIRIFVPAIAMVLILDLFYPVIHNEKSLIDNIACLVREGPDLNNVITNLLGFHASGWKDGFYLWYIFELVKIYIYLPLLDLLCTENEKSNKARRYIIFIMGVNELVLPFLNTFVNFSLHSFMDIGLWYILTGYEIKMYVKGNRCNKVFWAGIYITACIVMCLFTVTADIGRDMQLDETYWAWNRLLPAVSGIAFFIFIYTLTSENKFLMDQQKIILFLGKASFGVYLIHYLVIVAAMSYGLTGKIYKKYHAGSVFLLAVVYYLISVSIVSCLLYIKEKVKYKASKRDTVRGRGR